MKNNILWISILVFSLISCNDDTDDTCIDAIIETTGLETEYGCTNTKYQMDIFLNDDYVVIKNQETFDEMISGSCLPSIDFSLYDLVVGKKGLTTGNTSIAYELIKNCKTGNENLKVTFNQNMTAEAPNLTYHALIPKLNTDQVLAVEIIVN